MDPITSTNKQSVPLFRHTVDRYYHPNFDLLRLFLMFFMCLKLSDFRSTFGGFIGIFSGFATLSFYILSGYLVLREDPDRSARILRTVKRSAIVFAALAVAYFLLNLLYYRLIGENLFADLSGKKVRFDFFVLNLWPLKLGSSIWYVQAYLYAYCIIFLLDKCALLRFDWLLALLLIALTVVSGELCTVFGWSWQGYAYLPGCFLTRALPYSLLGCFIHRKKKKFKKVLGLFYQLMIPLGVVLMTVEILLLDSLGKAGYYGHLFGMGIVAFAVCMLAVQGSHNKRISKLEYFFENFMVMSRWHVNCVYYLFQPVFMLLALLLSSEYAWFLATLFCFAAAWLLAGKKRKAPYGETDHL